MSAAFGEAANPTIAWPQPVARDAPPRDAGLDALRAALTLLVLFHHAAHTYSGLGGWYLSDGESSKALGTTILRVFLLVNQAYFMGLKALSIASQSYDK